MFKRLEFLPKGCFRSNVCSLYALSALLLHFTKTAKSKLVLMICICIIIILANIHYQLTVDCNDTTGTSQMIIIVQTGTSQLFMIV